jgi:putative SOS response-associated peptidase YedK
MLGRHRTELIMCGRFGQHLSWAEIVELYNLTMAPGPNAYHENWNVAPTQDVAVVRFNPEDRARHGDLIRWGLVPHWAKDVKIAYKTINARCETVASTAAFRSAFKAGRRCVVPANGFYEWKKTDDPKVKQPYWITRADGKPLSLAGLWEGWKDPASGEWLRTFTIITTTPNALVEQLHDRMPVVLHDEDVPAWLGEVPATPEELQAMLKPYPAELMRMWPVDRRVGNPRNTGPDLILEVAV